MPHFVLQAYYASNRKAHTSFAYARRGARRFTAMSVLPMLAGVALGPVSCSNPDDDRADRQHYREQCVESAGAAGTAGAIGVACHGRRHWHDGDSGDGKAAGKAGSDSGKPERHHVIVMIGDGMSLSSEVAASRYLYGADFGLSFHAFPSMTFKTTWDKNVYDARATDRGAAPYTPEGFDPKLGYDPELGGDTPYPLLEDNDERKNYFAFSGWIHPDSASTATAMSTGKKTNSAAIGWSPGGVEGGQLENSPELLRRTRAMAVGAVTTVPFSHATPAGFFTHSLDRGNVADIANQMLNVFRPEVVIGGGWQSSYYSEVDLERSLGSNEWSYVHPVSGTDPNDALLAAAIRANQANQRLLGLYVSENAQGFNAPMPRHNPGSPSIDSSTLDRPNLSTSSIAALEVLSQDPDGFFLVVEQGHVDWANHRSDYGKMVGCVWELDQAVQAVVKFVDRPNDAIDWSNTTLIVTADHANGYLRFARKLGKGELPNEVIDTSTGSEVISYPDSEISFGSSGSHTSELVAVYVKGYAAPLVKKYETSYPGHRIIDDTNIYDLTMDAAGR